MAAAREEPGPPPGGEGEVIGVLANPGCQRGACRGGEGGQQGKRRLSPLIWPHVTTQELVFVPFPSPTGAKSQQVTHLEDLGQRPNELQAVAATHAGHQKRPQASASAPTTSQQALEHTAGAPQHRRGPLPPTAAAGAVVQHQRRGRGEAPRHCPAGRAGGKSRSPGGCGSGSQY